MTHLLQTYAAACVALRAPPQSVRSSAALNALQPGHLPRLCADAPSRTRPRRSSVRMPPSQTCITIGSLACRRAEPGNLLARRRDHQSSLGLEETVGRRPGVGGAGREMKTVHCLRADCSIQSTMLTCGRCKDAAEKAKLAPIKTLFVLTRSLNEDVSA